MAQKGSFCSHLTHLNFHPLQEHSFGPLACSVNHQEIRILLFVSVLFSWPVSETYLSGFSLHWEFSLVCFYLLKGLLGKVSCFWLPLKIFCILLPSFTKNGVFNIFHSFFAFRLFPEEKENVTSMQPFFTVYMNK
jgi:hypothetical protein